MKKREISTKCRRRRRRIFQSYSEGKLDQNKKFWLRQPVRNGFCSIPFKGH